MNNPLNEEVIKQLNAINKAVYGVPYIKEDEPADDKYANLKVEDDAFVQEEEE